jgi:polyadenylate-binding protein
MVDDYDPAQGEYLGPSPHPYLHEPTLHISNLPSYVTDENLAQSLVPCGPFRPKIPRGGDSPTLNGIIEFRDLNKGMQS